MPNENIALIPNYIIVIYGVDHNTYNEIKADLTAQMQVLGIPIPLFVNLPADGFTSLEVVWIEKPETLTAKFDPEQVKAWARGDEVRASWLEKGNAPWIKG